MKRAGALIIFCSFFVGIPAFSAEARTNLPVSDSSGETHQFTNLWRVGVEDKESTPDWPRTIQALASVLNLLLVCYLFLLAKRHRDQDRENDFNDRLLERKAGIACFWIEELIMKPHHKEIQDFFDKYENHLKALESNIDEVCKGRNRRKASAEIENFKAQYHTLNQRVTESLILVDQRFVELQPVFGEIEDLVTSELSKIPGVPKPENAINNSKPPPCEQLADLRCRFFKTVHNIQTEIVLEPRKNRANVKVRKKRLFRAAVI